MAATNKSGPAAAPMPPGIDLDTAAKLAMCSPRQIQLLVKAGFIPRPERGRYILVGVVHGRIKSLQEERKNATKTASDTRLKDLKAREVELRIEQTEHRLIGTEDALAVLEEVVGLIKAESSGLPAKIARDRSTRQLVEKELDGVFTRAADRLAERGRALRAGGDAVPADEEDDA